MEIINLGENNSILNQFVAELRDIHIQKDRLRFRRNIERAGEIMAYEISKRFDWHMEKVESPLGCSRRHNPPRRLAIPSGIPQLFRPCRECVRVSLPQIQRPVEFRHPYRIHRFSTDRGKDSDHNRPDACHRQLHGTCLRSIADKRST